MADLEGGEFLGEVRDRVFCGRWIGMSGIGVAGFTNVVDDAAVDSFSY